MGERREEGVSAERGMESCEHSSEQGRKRAADKATARLVIASPAFAGRQRWDAEGESRRLLMATCPSYPVCSALLPHCNTSLLAKGDGELCWWDE